ncbi:PTS fructose transporter subunit IIC [Enterococcus pallens]|uniref:PTS system, Fru family, IIC component n=1 Tax=Enterococcus pallens ATCC BAA-351 TaxID=1158607 RepID=R2QS81_9ENTE|nr:fructose-specific PTS transporter subunit EIIC [Enterococcus pallens]EOH98068.1 PTS system, Fru family, IIC component [Enterococcus pallens ATCC BAA-351]EOU20513.1 PTS system fructose-specific transporter subunit IIBC [Enterococcus pallens ATCC BAA-351]
MKIVGITACPTGIAHTYMSAEKLEVTAASLGYQAKFETQGAKVENELTRAEIEAADAIIIAVDKDIDLSRFAGKEVKRVSTGRAIKEAEKVIEEALNNQGTMRVSSEKKAESSQQKAGIYNHFMNGVNYMLPFVIAGGIIIALSFAFGITASDPESADYNVLAGALSTIGGGTAFAMMVPALGAGIASSIAGKPGFAPGIVAGLLAANGGSGFLGGMIGGLLAGYVTNFMANKISIKKQFAAIYQLIVVPLVSILLIGLAMVFLIDQPIAWVLDALTSWLNGLGNTSGLLFGLLIGVMMAADMGGPINKSISTFSIGLMSAGVNAPIAACMAAGMTPPLGLALATILFKNKFTKEERTSGQSCWILGASYITEGAIPFAVADPIRVIPSLMLGSATAAGISMAAGVTSMAPHGGIWVMLIPNVMNNLPMYLLALVAGTVVTALSVGLLKKPVTIEETEEKLTNEVEV